MVKWIGLYILTLLVKAIYIFQEYFPAAVNRILSYRKSFESISCMMSAQQMMCNIQQKKKSYNVSVSIRNCQRIHLEYRNNKKHVYSHQIPWIFGLFNMHEKEATGSIGIFYAKFYLYETWLKCRIILLGGYEKNNHINSYMLNDDYISFSNVVFYQHFYGTLK